MNPTDSLPAAAPTSLETSKPVETAAARSPYPWLLLFGRTGLFILIQALFTLAYRLAGSTGEGFTSAWEAGAAWWPLVVTITNLICLAAMITLFRQEGKSYWSIFRIRREQIKSDLPVLLLTLLIAGPVGFLPNLLLATGLFGGSQPALDLLLRPLPLWVVFTSLVTFPVTQGLTELPVYFSYAMPHLQKQGLPAWLAVTLCSLMLGLQHFAVPLVFDMRFIAWRGLMFIPFGFLVGIVLHWRPRLLPYLAFTHVLMDLSFASMLLGVAY